MSPKTSRPFEQRVGKILTLAHLTVCVVLLLAGAGFIFWEQWNAQGEKTAVLAVNELRILATSTQRIVLQVVRQNQASGSDKDRLAAECKKSLASFKSLSSKLRDGERGTEEARRLRQDLESKADRLVRRIEAILSMKPGIALTREDYESLYLLAVELTGQLDKISDHETQQASERAERHQTLNWIFSGLLAAFTATAFFAVFRPLTRKLAREAGSLEQSAGLLLQKKAFAERGTTAWSLFVCHASQRIRKAVHDIVTRAGALEQELIAKKSGENADYAAWIRERGSQILGVVNDTLNLGFIESRLTPLMPRAVHLSRLLQDMTPHLQPAAENKGLVYTLNLHPADVWVMGDADQIWRMVEKIFDNAIKYTRHGEVSITVSALPDGRVTIAVRDTGCGIPPNALPHIFEPQPYEEEAEAGLEHGLGINLSVAQQLATHMGSVISVHSEMDKGTTFLIDMPGCTEDGQLLTKA